MQLEMEGGTETFQVPWSWQRPILAQIRHGGACYGMFSQGPGEDLTGERSSLFSAKNPATLTTSPKPWTFTIESPNTTSVPWRRTISSSPQVNDTAGSTFSLKRWRTIFNSSMKYGHRSNPGIE